VRSMSMCLVGLVLFVQAVCADATDPELADDVIAKSGVQAQLDQFPRHLLAGLDAGRDPNHPIPTGFHEAARAAAAEAFDTQQLTAGIRATLTESLSDDDLRGALAWLDSDLGRHVTALEIAANHPDQQSELIGFAAGLVSAPPAAERIELIQALDNAAEVTASTLEATLGVQLAVASAMAAAAPEDRRPSIRTLAELVESTRPQLEPVLRGQVEVALLFTYRTLDATQLTRYLAFCQSPMGRRYNHAMFDGLRIAMIDSSFRFGGLLARILRHGPIARGA